MSAPIQFLIAKELKIQHLLAASTSSVYGDNSDIPFAEDMKCDTPLSFGYQNLMKLWGMPIPIYSIPMTFFRFFTVYGPWGRPDMALFKFTKNIISDEPIDVYNHGEMSRDFTFVKDLVHAIFLLIDKPPSLKGNKNDFGSFKSAPFRILNIGNSAPVSLPEYIEAIEDALGKKARKNYLPMQQGDVPATWSDTKLLRQITGYTPDTNVSEGIREFVSWYKEYYRIKVND